MSQDAGGQELSSSGTSAGRRDDQRRATREALIAAANELFDEVGYDGARTSEIAARADVAQATLFRHFGAKADLALAHLRHAVGELVEALERRPQDETPYAAITAVVRGPRFDGLASPQVAAEGARIGANPELVGHVYRIVTEAKLRLASDFASRLGIEPAGPRAVVLANVVVDIAIYTMEASVDRDADAATTFVDALDELRPLLDVSDDRGGRGR